MAEEKKSRKGDGAAAILNLMGSMLDFLDKIDSFVDAQMVTENKKKIVQMAEQVKNGRFHLCPSGSHFEMYDDQEVYFEGLIQFIKDVDQGIFESKE